MDSFFIISDLDNSEYNLIKDSQEPHIIELREHLIKCWKMYQPYADKKFEENFPKNMEASYWEMYLTCAFLEKSLPVKKRPLNRKYDKGPDIVIEDKNCRILIEATTVDNAVECFKSGEKNPERIMEPDYCKANKIEIEKQILRYTKMALFRVPSFIITDQGKYVAVKAVFS